MRITLLLLFLFAPLSFASAEQSISRDAFFTLIESRIPARLCTLESFKNCFKEINQFQCTLFLARAMKGCSAGWRQKYSEKITTGEAVEIGDMLGVCAAEKFRKSFDKSPKKTALCLAQYKKKKVRTSGPQDVGSSNQ